MTKLLDDLAEVVRRDGQEGRFDAACLAAIRFIRTHAAEIKRNARDAERYRVAQTITPYRFKKIQDASISDACDVLYFHKDRFDAEIDAMQETGR